MPCSPGRRSRTREQIASISSASACAALTANSTPPSPPSSKRLAYLDPARDRGAAAQLATEPPTSARRWASKSAITQAQPAPAICVLFEDAHIAAGPAAPLGQRCRTLGGAGIGP